MTSNYLQQRRLFFDRYRDLDKVAISTRNRLYDLEWHVVTTVEQFTEYLTSNLLPDIISIPYYTENDKVFGTDLIDIIMKVYCEELNTLPIVLCHSGLHDNCTTVYRAYTKAKHDMKVKIVL